ncbi:DUF5689 domain-containing protein [Sabulibacter ruber]|uniref:DUF5689 domain-containing protein n=1 Tax=Sabulibacter ruber TaxID=2811901 RepID=UPI001A95F976|nr:DUF5689 domain-containing protein [Sabulibacter ruber]
MKNKIVSLFSLLCALVFTGCLEEDVNNAIGTPSPIISIEDVRSFHKGSDVALGPDQLMGARQILGVVISDAAGQNVPGGASNLVIQNHRRGQLRGITLNVDGGNTASYKIGDSVVVNVTGTTLTRRNGILQIVGVKPTAITKVSENAKVHLREVTMEELVNKPQNYEGTLVRLAAGNVSPVPTSNATFSGDKTLAGGNGKSMVLHTEPTAAFANQRVYASATYTGIPVLVNNGEPVVQFWVRTINDVKDPSGPIYAGFPEGFEAVPQTAKGSYNMTAIDNNITVGTGSWKLLQAILGNTAGRDRFTGQHGIRMQQQLTTDALVQMNFDVPNGASKVTMLYGSYYNDASSTWRLEYSQDQGTTWTQVGPTVTDASSTEKTAVFLMDISGPVRFRIVKVGLGATTPTVQNGRLCFDDIAVYQN